MKVIIIGNGIAGSTAARFIRKMSEHEITMISDESKYPFSRTALMYVYMGHLTFEHTKLYEDTFWDKNRINILQGKVDTIDTEQKKIVLADHVTLDYDKLIIATGSSYNKFGWPGQDLENVCGLYHLQDLQRMEEASQQGIKRAVIVGGGLIGLEMAEMFLSRSIPVTMLVRESSFWNMVLPEQESKIINTHITAHGVDLRFNTTLKEIKGEHGKVNSIVTEDNVVIHCDYVGLTVGVSPNIAIAKSSSIQCNKGIIVNDYLQTSDESVYAIGDCAELSRASFGRRNIEAVWYTGRAMGQIAAANVCGKNQQYKQGVWFNSAKFFDIEYQVYGYVPTIEIDKTKSIFWQHADNTKSIRLVYDQDTQFLLGINLLGVRYRHEVIEKWIVDKTPINEVIANLSLANFDPEFFEEYEQDLVDIYNTQMGTSLKLRSKRKLSLVQKFLQKI